LTRPHPSETSRELAGLERAWRREAIAEKLRPSIMRFGMLVDFPSRALAGGRNIHIALRQRDA